MENTTYSNYGLFLVSVLILALKTQHFSLSAGFLIEGLSLLSGVSVGVALRVALKI